MESSMMQRAVCTCGGGARGGEVRGTDDDVLDLETGHGRRRREDPPPAPAPAPAKPPTVLDLLRVPGDVLFDLDDRTDRARAAAEKAFKCILRGLIVLLWVYLLDLMRRYTTTQSAEALILTICPLGFLFTAASLSLFMLMGCVDEYVQITLPSDDVPSY